MKFKVGQKVKITKYNNEVIVRKIMLIEKANLDNLWEPLTQEGYIIKTENKYDYYFSCNQKDWFQDEHLTYKVKIKIL